MALPVFQHAITDYQGNAKRGANVTITREYDGSFAELYSDREGDNLLSSVGAATADDDGVVEVYLAPGVYRMVASYGPLTRTYKYVTVHPLNGLIEESGTARTLELADAGNYLRFTSASSVTVTIPAQADVNFPVGTEIPCRQAGEGDVQFVEASGVTINPPAGGTPQITSQGVTMVLRKVGTDEWDVAYTSVSYDSGAPILKNTVADMVGALDLTIGDTIRTLEHTSGYGYEGGNLYKIGSGFGTADGGSIIDLDNGLQAMALFASGVNVRQFGAAGDGSTDDSTAIQAAVDYVGGVGGGDVVFNNTTYLCGTALTVEHDDVALVCNSSHAILDFSGTADGTVGVTLGASATRITNIRMEGIRIKKTTAETKGGGGIGLRVSGCIRANIKRVYIDKFDTCFELDDIASGPASGCYFENMECEDPSTQHIRVAGCIDTTFQSCIFSGFAGGHTQNALLQDSANGRRPNATHFNNCMFIAAGGTKPTNNLLVESGFWNTFKSCVFERASGPHVRFQYASTPVLSEISAVFERCWTNGTDSGAALLISGEGAHVHSTNCRWHTDASGSTLGAVSFEPAAPNTELNCVFTGNTVRANSGFGIWNRRADGVVINGNRVSVITGTAIQLEGNTARCTVVTNVATSGIVDNGAGNVVANNVV